MSLLSPEKLRTAFEKFGQLLAHLNAHINNILIEAQHHNAWFTPEMTAKSTDALKTMLNPADLHTWFQDIKVTDQPRRVGLVMAGNIPLVGFHDALCVIATGNIALIKLSSADDKLLPALFAELIKIEPAIEAQIIYIERLKDFDAVIATGSNNSSRYFEYYFKKVPHIIRKNRNSIAILTGNETTEEIAALGHDIFDYFGLGCRNVSKIFIPEGYEIKNFFEPLEPFQPIINHFKYNNNYDYNKSIYLVNTVPHLDNGFLLLKEDTAIASPLAVLFYEKYNDLAAVSDLLAAQEQNIQCMIGAKNDDLKLNLLNFGQSQKPKLWDYADNVNTIEFLNKL